MAESLMVMVVWTVRGAVVVVLAARRRNEAAAGNDDSRNSRGSASVVQRRFRSRGPGRDVVVALDLAGIGGCGGLACGVGWFWLGWIELVGHVSGARTSASFATTRDGVSFEHAKPTHDVGKRARAPTTRNRKRGQKQKATRHKLQVRARVGLFSFFWVFLLSFGLDRCLWGWCVPSS